MKNARDQLDEDEYQDSDDYHDEYDGYNGRIYGLEDELKKYEARRWELAKAKHAKTNAKREISTSTGIQKY